MMIKVHNFYRGKQEKLFHSCNIPPDTIFCRKSKHLKVIPGDDHEKREIQKKKMSKLIEKKGNTTMKTNNRQYVPYQLYKNVVGQFFIVEPKRDVTTVEVQYVDVNGEQKRTNIEFLNVSLDSTMTKKLNNNLEAMMKSSKCRGNTPMGDMVAGGDRNNSIHPVYKATEVVDGHLITELNQLFKDKFPSTISEIETSCNVNGSNNKMDWPKQLRGGPTNFIVASPNLSNEAHVDINDASKSIAIWHEKNPTLLCNNWYLLFPNVRVNNGHSYQNGLAIKLRHGTIIVWDGRVLRHCTSITEVEDGNAAYCTFFARRMVPI